jgi:hypothetical protein
VGRLYFPDNYAWSHGRHLSKYQLHPNIDGERMQDNWGVANSRELCCLRRFPCTGNVPSPEGMGRQQPTIHMNHPNRYIGERYMWTHLNIDHNHFHKYDLDSGKDQFPDQHRLHD